MRILFLSSLLSQAAVMAVDEFYFHWKRNLSRWERWGHPVDTFFFLLPLSLLSFFHASSVWRIVYFCVSALSTLVITKDEWIHRQEASSLEQWLHSLLFILHPVVLISAFWVWTEETFPFVTVWSGVFIFWLYQIIFWNFYADRLFKTRLGNY